MTEAKKDELTREEQEQIAGGTWMLTEESAPLWKPETQDPKNPAPERVPRKLL